MNRQNKIYLYRLSKKIARFQICIIENTERLLNLYINYLILCYFQESQQRYVSFHNFYSIMIEAKIFCYGISYVWEGNIAIDKIQWKYESINHENPQITSDMKRSPMTKKIEQFPLISHQVANKTSQLVIRKYSSIFKEILNHKFSNLQNLILTNLKLVSVQYLSYIDAQNIKYICLNYNNLTDTSVQNIVKGNFPQLKRLKLDQNFIWTLDLFSQLETKKIWKFQIEYFYKHHFQIPDLSFLLKLGFQNNKDFEQLYIRSKDRIRNQSLQQALRRKYNKLDIWAYDDQ